MSTTVASAGMATSCDSCGHEDGDLIAVHRKYVTPESWDTPGSEKVLADVEHWCFACCTHYPHDVVADPG